MANTEIYRFKVAGNSFSIEMTPEIWQCVCDAYMPFIIPCESEGEDIFKLHFAEQRTDLSGSKEWENLGDFGEDGSVMNVFRGGGDYNYLIELGDNSDIDNYSQLLINKGFKKANLYINNNSKTYGLVVNNALMLMYAFASAPFGTMLFHSSVTMYNGFGYMFLGRSGTGKSTHSKLWLKHIPNTELLNDDNPAVRVENNGEVFVYGTPWSGKTPCYKNIKVKVGGLVRLQQAPHNSISRLSVFEAYGAVMPSISCMKWERDLADNLHNNISNLVVAVPIYCLDCLPDRDAAYTSFNELTKNTK